MSDYVKLASERKSALLKGDERKASEPLIEMRRLSESGKVRKDEYVAAAYL